MSQVGNDKNRFGGRFFIQDSDHMSEIPEVAQKETPKARQADQSQSRARQQGGADPNNLRPRQAN